MYTDATPPITTVEEVLDGVAGVREQQRLLDRGLVILAVEWAKHNPGDPGPEGDPGIEGMEDQWIFDQLFAKGCLTFDDSTVSDFSISAGLTEHSARKLIRESLMLVHLLPRVWSRVLSGKQDVWRARHLAGDCFDLSIKAIEFIDRHMSERTARITVTSRERIITEARKRFMPEEHEAAEEEARQRRNIEIFSYTQDAGVVQVQGALDLPDALALDAALNAGARALKAAGCDAPLGTRRAWALGDLARFATGGQSLFTAPGLGAEVPPADPAAAARPHWNGQGAPPANVKLFIHMPSSTFLGGDEDSLGLVEGTGLTGPAVISTGTVREWFTRPTAAPESIPGLSIRPVIDVGEESDTPGYQPTRQIREKVQLRAPVCVFPFCARAAHRCDIDHIEPWQEDGRGGATCTCNLAPLCRTHHRVKTHGDNAPGSDGKHNAWSYVHLGGQEYYWNGPRGMQFIRNSRGTYNANPTQNDGAPPHPAVPGAPPGPVDLGDDDARTRIDHLIDRLLAKASMTRGVHNRDYSPMWTLPSQEGVSEPPAGYECDEDPGDSITFFVPYAPPGAAAS